MALTNLAPSIANQPNLTALVNAFDACVSHSTQPLMPMLTDICPNAYLPFLAQNFSLTEEPNWQVAQTNNQQRDTIKKAIELHRIKGTPQAVKTILSDANLEATLTEPEDKPNHYQVTIQANSVLNDQSLTNTRLLITQVAPASSVPFFVVADQGQAVKLTTAFSIATLTDSPIEAKTLHTLASAKLQGFVQSKSEQHASRSLNAATQSNLTIFAHIRKMS